MSGCLFLSLLLNCICVSRLCFFKLILVVLLQNSLDDDDANQCKDILDKGISETKEDREEAVDMQVRGLL